MMARQAIAQARRKGRIPVESAPPPRPVPMPEVRPREKSDAAEILRTLDRTQLFRFAYVPFSIAQLVWDYVGTINDLAALMRIRETRPLARTVVALRREYDRIRAPYVDEQHQRSEVDNMYVFEDAVKSITDLYLINLRSDLEREYPLLDKEYVDYLTAVYQALILYDALMEYTDRQRLKVERMLGRGIGNLMPGPFYRLRGLIGEYIGDKPISDAFKARQRDYVITLATQMALIELDDGQMDYDD